MQTPALLPGFFYISFFSLLPPAVRPYQRPRRYRLRRRPPALPAFWCRLTHSRGFADYLQKREWELLFSARNIPYRLDKFSGREHLYVPPMYAGIAQYELEAFSHETRIHSPAASLTVPPTHAHTGWTALLPLFLILWHGWREGWWRCPFPWPDVSRWCNLGELDSVRIAVHGEYYRFSTALTLHQDTPHLWGNVLFSLIFLPLLARASGTGHALLICLLGGSIGNAANYLFRQHAFISLGFSTALFAGLGALSGIATLYQRKKALIPLAAGMALLSMLGTGGEDVDYLAHCCGFGAGFFLGVLEGWQSRHRLRWRLPQSIACLLVILLLLLAWWLAFRV